MEDKLIKDILHKDLKNITTEDFNKKIIQRLNLSKKEKTSILFNQKSIIKWFLIASIFVLIANLNFIENLSIQTIIIGTFICISPLYFMVFNKIYQTTIQNS